MARRKLRLTVDGLAGSFARGGPDDVPDEVFEQAAALLRRHGLHRWRMEDLADAAAVGRTSLYRWFGSRQEVVEAVLARELRRTITAIGRASRQARADGGDVEAELVAAMAVAGQHLEGSVVEHLLRHDPEAVLPLLTVDAGPLVAVARQAMAPWFLARAVAADQAQAEAMGELLARVGLSYVLTRPTAAVIEPPAGADPATAFVEVARSLLRASAGLAALAEPAPA